MPISPFVRQKMERFTVIARELAKETDRGCAVLTLCVLEETLHGLFKAIVALPGKKLGALAPPGRLAAAIPNARLLGLLSQREAKCFHALNGIRNEFAHGVLEDLKFDSPEIAPKVQLLRLPLDLEMGWDPEAEPVRFRFLLAASLLQMAMLVRTEHTPRLFAATDVGGAIELPSPDLFRKAVQRAS